jgi:Carboxypeptidase regulatory-like domain
MYTKGLAFLVLLLLLTCSSPASAQVDVASSTLKGTITDQQGALVVGAVVTATNVDKGLKRTATTDDEGAYSIPLLPPGAYKVEIEARGFGKVFNDNVRLTVGQGLVYDVQLNASSITAQVAITGDLPLIEVERTQQANTISTQQVENLSNVGRTFQSYVYTLPGVSSSTAPRVQFASRVTGFQTSGFSIGGSNGRNNLITVDGGENELGSGAPRYDVSTEAIQEFQVNRNSFSAEFGFTAGTAVNIVTKSGTNKFHGSGFFFYRSDATSARNPFDTLNPGKQSADRQFFPGFTLGGPIVKNKLFFFTNYERTNIDSARFRSYTNDPLTRPNALQLASLAILDASSNANVRRIGTNLRAALTTTATSYPGIFNMLLASEGVFTGINRLNTFSTRIDYHMSASDSINGRFTLTRNFNDDIGGSNVASPSIATTLTQHDQTGVVTWTHTFSSGVINQLRGQFSPDNLALTAPPEPAVTGLIVSGLAGFGRYFGAPYDVTQDRYQIEDNLTWVKGNHTFKFGGSYRPATYDFRNDLWFSGEWQFQSSAVYPITLAVPAADRPAFLAALAGTAIPQLNPLQNLDLNLPFLYRQGFNNPTWQGTGHYVGGFAQDTWKVNQRLTLDLGGRIDWDGEPPPVPRHAYFSPRLGFAWKATSDGKTVLRGGSGLFYSPIYFQIPGYTSVLNGSGQYINQISKSPLNGVATLYGAGVAGNAACNVAPGTLPFGVLTEAQINCLGTSTAAGAPGRVLFELNPDYKNNYTIQANFGVQREIAKNLSIEVAYQMYHGLHIQQPVGLNYCEAGTPGCPATPANLTAMSQRDPRLGPLYRVCGADTKCFRVNDAGITQFTDYESRGSSIYHGLTTSLTKRFSNHFSFQANYTWSKAIDDQTDFNSAFAPPFPTRLFTERSLSAFDIRHNFVVSGVIESPFKSGPDHNFGSRALADITVSPSIFIRSGIPFTLRTGVDINSDTRGGTDRLFNIARNTGLGPDYRSVNLRISKAFRFKADSPMRLEASADFANIFNRTNFSAVNEILPVTVGATGILTFPDPLAAADYASTTNRLEGKRDRSLNQPLGFTSAFNPRQILWGVKFVF